MHIIVIVVNDIIVILKHISKLGTRKRLLNTKIEPNFADSKKSNVDGGTCLAAPRMGRLPRRLICLADRLTFSPTAPASARLALNPRKSG